MPRNNKRKYKKKGRKIQRYSRGFSFSPMPTRFGTHFRYVTRVQINPTSALAGVHIFRANSIYDPDQTTTLLDNSARGFQQLVGVLYDHFTVIGSKIKCTVLNPGTTIPVVASIALKDSNVANNNMLDYMENGRANTTVVSTAGSSNEGILYKGYSYKFLGMKDPLDNQNLRGDSASNPQEQAYFHVAVASMDGSSDPGAVTVLVEIDYNVVLTEPIQPPISI